MESVSRLRAFVHEGYGLCMGPDKDYLVVSRLTPLLRDLGLPDLGRLYEAVRQDPKGSLAQHVVAALTTNETSWFRDGRPFEYFKSFVLPQLLKDKAAGDSVRIWSAASSTGQEPYSIAMCLDEESRICARNQVSILASDVSRKALDQAREGLYTQFEMSRGLPANLADRYFRTEGTRSRIVPSLQSRIAFLQVNLIEIPKDLGSFDVIFCRNVMIYFDDQTRNAVMASLVEHLAPGGYLFFGSAETIHGYARDLLTLMSPGIYRKDF